MRKKEDAIKNQDERKISSQTKLGEGLGEKRETGEYNVTDTNRKKKLKIEGLIHGTKSC